jgi:hypothetical protein
MASSVVNPGDPLLLATIMHVEKTHLIRGEIFQLFETNNFYPYTNTLAYTDHSFTLTFLSLPVALFSDNLIFNYNFVLLLSWFLCGLGGFYLTRYYTKSDGAALVGGIVLEFNPFHYAQIDHLQSLAYQFIPFALLFLEKAISEKRGRNYLFFVLFSLASIMVSFYHAAYLAILIVIIMIFRFFTGSELKNLNKLIAFGVSFTVIGLVNLPLILPYLKFSEELNVFRRVEDSIYNSTSPQRLLVGNAYNIFYKSTLTPYLNDPLFNPSEFAIFFGFAIYILVLSGFIGLNKKRLKLVANRTQLLYLIITVTAFVLSLGPYLSLNNSEFISFLGNPIPLPYKFLYNNIILFQALRVPTRFFIIVGLGLAVLGAVAFQRLHNAKYKYGRVLSLLLVGFMLLEFLSIPLPVKEVPYSYKNTYAFLSRQAGSDWSIFEFSLNENQDTYTTFYSALHDKKTLNGYSGFSPEGIERLEEYAQRRFVRQTATIVEILRNIKVKFVVIHGSEIPDENYLESLITKLNANQYSKLVFQNDLEYVYQLTDSEGSLETDPAISYTYTNTTFNREDMAFANIVIKNNSSRIWTNPGLAKYTVEINVAGTRTVKTLIKPLYLLPNEEVHQSIRLNKPFFWDKNLNSITVAVKANG